MGAIDSSATSEDLNQQDRAGMTRRSVVRAGAAAAWAVPLVTVAAAAPSFAASGEADLSSSKLGTASRGTGGQTDRATIPITITNTNTQPSGTLTVTIVSAANDLHNGQAAPAGWTVVASGGTNGNRNTVTYTAGAPIGGNTSLGSLNFVVRGNSDGVRNFASIGVNPGRRVGAATTGTSAPLGSVTI
jgi:hypothetical protein